MFTTEQLQIVYETAQRVIVSNPWRALDYLLLEELNLWCVRVYEGYRDRKVLTERVYGKCDVTIILSDEKLSVILNETHQHSWAKADGIFEFDDIYTDIENLLTVLDIAILRAELN